MNDNKYIPKKVGFFLSINILLDDLKTASLFIQSNPDFT